MLLKFSEIEKGLEKLFCDIPTDIRAELTDLKLKESPLSTSDLLKIESILEVQLPDIFKRTILKYDFGGLTLGAVCFGNKENYVEYLIKRNTLQTKNREKDTYFLAWWGFSKRSLNHIMIGESNEYLILLNIETDGILAYSRTESYANAKPVASDFEIFVRAAATIYLRSQNELDNPMLSSIFSSANLKNRKFWQEII